MNQQRISTEETTRKLTRKATKLQPRQLKQILANSIAADKLTQKETSEQLLIRLFTTKNEPLHFDCQWGTRLNLDDTDWVFQLFRRNMRNFYMKSCWGYDECSKLQELQATTARFLILRNEVSRPIAYAHFRFVEDDSRAVLYCYELQVESDYQKIGIGSILINLMECLAKSTRMEAIVATVFAFNGPSLAFFHKMGFRSDRTCLISQGFAESECDFLILSKLINEVENCANEIKIETGTEKLFDGKHNDMVEDGVIDFDAQATNIISENKLCEENNVRINKKRRTKMKKSSTVEGIHN